MDFWDDENILELVVMLIQLCAHIFKKSLSFMFKTLKNKLKGNPGVKEIRTWRSSQGHLIVKQMKTD